MCGASEEQKAMFKSQSGFNNLLSSKFAEIYGAASSVFNQIQKAWTPIQEAGASQHGMSGAEKTAAVTTNTEGVAKRYGQVSKALGENAATLGGGNTFIPSGAEKQEQAQVASEAAGAEAAGRNAIEARDWDIGRQNFYNASNVLSGATQVFNPATSMAGQVTDSGRAAAQSANDIAAANNAALQAGTSMIGGAAGALLGNPGLFSKKPA